MSVADEHIMHRRHVEVLEDNTKSVGFPPARVKTRLLRRNNPSKPAAEDLSERQTHAGGLDCVYPRGSITVIGGSERGISFDLTEEFMRIGRDCSQEIQLSKDDAVSRESHAVIGFVPEYRRFMIFDGGKVNPVWVNDIAISDAVFLENGDIIRIGETTLCLNEP